MKEAVAATPIRASTCSIGEHLAVARETARHTWREQK